MTSQALPGAARSGAARPRTEGFGIDRSRGVVRRGAPRVRPLAVFILAVLVAFFGMIFSRISVDRTAFELEELDREITVELERMDRLRVETARLLNPARITDRAEDLGLVFPERRTPLRAKVPSQPPTPADIDLRTLRTERP